MTKNPRTVDASSPATEVARLMRDENIGDVLVMDGDRLCGIVTDRDIVLRGVAETADLGSVKIGKTCSQELWTVRADDDAEHAVSLMRERAIRRLPVVDGDRPIGVVSLGDLAIDRDRKSALADISAAPANN